MIIVFVFLFSVLLLGTVRAFAQQPTPTSAPTPVPTIAPTPTLVPTPDLAFLDLEKRVYRLEVQQEQAIQSLETTSELTQAAVKVAGGFVAILIAIQGFVTYKQVSREGRVSDLQAKNLEAVNTITTVIAQGAEKNVNSLNVILATFQRMMDFKVTEAENTQKLVEKMQSQLDELKKAQRQQVEELLQSAERLRRGRSMYTSPDPTLRRQMDEFRAQMNLMQQVMLDRYTGVDSPAENRRYGEIYLRRGIIAYCDNDIFKSHKMLKIAEKFFPPLQQAEGMPGDQKFPVAFTQYYLALIEKNYGTMTRARDHIKDSYQVYGQNEPNELLTSVMRAEIFSYLEDMDVAQEAIQVILKRSEILQQREPLQEHDAIYALRARLLLGNTYYVGKEYGQALTYYNEALGKDESGYYSYYINHSIAQVYHKQTEKAEEGAERAKDEAKKAKWEERAREYEEKAKENKRLAYEALIATKHLQTKSALDTQILLNALAYLCTHQDQPEEAKKYRETLRGLWRRIIKVGDFELRLFSFEKKRPISKEDFWVEVIGG